jgi:hypothetical protein
VASLGAKPLVEGYLRKYYRNSPALKEFLNALKKHKFKTEEIYLHALGHDGTSLSHCDVVRRIMNRPFEGLADDRASPLLFVSLDSDVYKKLYSFAGPPRTAAGVATATSRVVTAGTSTSSSSVAVGPSPPLVTAYTGDMQTYKPTTVAFQLIVQSPSNTYEYELFSPSRILMTSRAFRCVSCRWMIRTTRCSMISTIRAR